MNQIWFIKTRCPSWSRSANKQTELHLLSIHYVYQMGMNVLLFASALWCSTPMLNH